MSKLSMKFGAFLLVCSLVLGVATTAVLASPLLSGEFTSSLAVDFPEPYALSAEQDLRLNLEKSLGRSKLFVGLRGIHSWPEQDGKVWDFALDEAYVDYYGDNFDLRLGKQRFSWGTAMQINPTNVINPIDITNPLGDKLPVYAVGLDYYLGDIFKITGVYVPFFKPALDAIPPMPGMPQIEVVKPEASLENGEFALKAAALGLGGVDFSLSYFTGKEDLPTVVFEPGMPPKAHYRDLQIFGADVATTFGDVGVWGEAAYSLPTNGDGYFQGIIGADYGFDNGLIVLGQYVYQRRDAKSTNLLLVGLNQQVGLHEWRMGAVYNIDVRSFMLNPEVSFSLADATHLVVGGRYFGNTNGPVGMLPQEQNQIYAQVKVSF